MGIEQRYKAWFKEYRMVKEAADATAGYPNLSAGDVNFIVNQWERLDAIAEQMQLPRDQIERILGEDEQKGLNSSR